MQVRRGSPLIRQSGAFSSPATKKHHIKMTAKIAKNALSIVTVHILDGKQWLDISVPRGWSQVKKMMPLVLQHNGRDHVFRGWDSDKNLAFFAENYTTAKVTK